MKRNIALVTGGYSGEAEISYKSADTISKNIDAEKWNCYRIDIQPSGWFYEIEEGKTGEVDKNDFSIKINEEKISFDAVILGLHGTPGEDGKLLGYFDCLKIPYTACNAATSAITFNKRYTVAVAAFAGLPVSQSIHLFNDQSYAVADILQKLTLPLFVKPNNGGSSLGISKVTSPGDLQQAIDKAFNEDSQVLVEEFIDGREFTIGVFRNKGETIALPITEIKTQNDFFDYNAKYQGASTEVTPAELDEADAENIRAHARKTYQLFNCKGVVRIDYILESKSRKPYMLEINTVPGQSTASIIPQQVGVMGWSLKDFYSALIEECLL